MAKSTTGQQIITNAAMHMRKTQNKIHSEQEQLLSLIKLLQENEEYSDFNFANLAKFVQQSLLNEIESVGAFNKAILANKEAGCITPYGIRTHKLLEILEGTIELATEENIGHLLAGRYVSGYHNEILDVLPTLGQKDEFWGTSKPTFLTTLMTSMYNVITGLGILNIDDSAMFHTFHLPESFDTTLVGKPSLFINIDDFSILTTHSGYSFGGDRLNCKEFRPQDCTSFLEMIVQLPANGASTVDLYLTARSLLKESLPVVDSSWLESAGGQMVKLFDINTKIPKAGDVWTCRKFNEASPLGSSLGYSGHASIYLGRDGEDMVTFAYNRDIPKIEGFGIESRVAEYNPETHFQCLLHRKDTGFTSFQEAYPFKDLGDLFGLTRFVDAQIGPIELDEEKEVELLLHGSVNEFIGYGE